MPARGTWAPLRPLALPAAVLLGLATRAVIANGTDVYFDEAYYWTWSQRLAPGYFDHAPLIAWLVAPFGPRAAAMLCGLATVAAVWGLARDVHGDRAAGWRAAALWCSTPAAALAGTFATPDAPLLLFWGLTLCAVWRQRWGLAGVCAGLAALSKYNAVLLGAAILVDAAARRRLPRGAWLALAIAGALFSPVVVWNSQHAWEGFSFQLRHGLGGQGGLASFGEYWAGQLAMAGPVLLPLALIWIARGPRSQQLLRAAAAVPLLVFALASLRTRGEANWPAAAWLAACVGLAGVSSRASRWAIGTGLVLCLAAAVHLVAPFLDLRRDVALERMHGWSELQILAGSPEAAVFTPSYQLASEVAYYARLPVGVSDRARRSQFTLWGAPPVPQGADALWLSEGLPPPPEIVAQYSQVEGPRIFPAGIGERTLRRFHVWKLVGRR